MPNHVTTKFTVEGRPSDVARFLLTHITHHEPDGSGEGPEWQLDFNTIIPKPACLEGIPSSSDVSLAVEALTGKTPEELSGKGLEFKDFFPRSKWTAERKANHQKQLDNLSDEQLAMGKRAIQAIEECGYFDWYFWCIDHWGTKWGAYSFRWVSQDLDRLVFLFETAWSVPIPIFKKLAELYPDLRFGWVSIDECWNFAASGAAMQGRFEETQFDADAKIYEEVHGVPWENPGDDEDEDEEIADVH